MEKLIYGGDSETVNGKPNSLQFFSGDCGVNEIIFCDETDARKKFLAWCGRRPKDVQHVVYVHNLAFDLIVFLWGAHEKLVSASGDFQFKAHGWNISGVYGAPTFARISNGHNKTIYLIDSFSFFRGSLAKAAELFCPGLPKLTRPKDLGQHRYGPRDTKFCAYAMRDSEVTYHIGRSLEKLHREFDLQQTLSVADMAARIFRHRFLEYTIPQPSRDIIDAALLSYHGGKNNVTVPAGWYSGVSSLDISSAYPHAMHDMPAFSNERLYRRFGIAKRGTRSVPDFGVYCISGHAGECNWPVLFSHSFKPLTGAIDRVQVQGFELNEALRSGEFKPSRITGFYYDAERDNVKPALRGFVADFYKRKESEKDKVLRYMYKLLLNSISGKFIQTRKTGRHTYVDIDADTVTTAAELVAGGMFHPFIASAITAHTRARIHVLEHRFKALHTATDGIFTQAKKVPPKAKGLGAIGTDAHGTLLLVRNKLYVLYSSRKTEQPSHGFKGKWIAKQALHGFQGNVTELERMIATGRRHYSTMRPNRLKESIKRGLTPNEFVKHPHTLKIGAIPLR